MTQDDGGYEVKPKEAAAGAGAAGPKPGEPGWVPPVPVVERAEGNEEAAEDPDVAKNKGMAVLAYICFVVPLVVAPQSKFARFHANQGLLTFICWCIAVLGNVALHLFDKYVTEHLKDLAVLHGFFTCAVYLVQPALLVGALALTLYGIIQAANGERKELPVVGQVTLIK